MKTFLSSLGCATLFLCLVGAPGCGSTSNEESFAATKGAPDKGVPETQEEYDLKYQANPDDPGAPRAKRAK